MGGRLTIVIILLALVAEITVLLRNLHMIEIPYWPREVTQTEAREAGYVMRSRPGLKRRGVDSLVWENAKDRDTVYYKDSILTLSQTEATIYLRDQTELHLSENTLVSIEEPDQTKNSEIRLKFARGDLRARSPEGRTELKDDEFSITLAKGSEITVRKDQGRVELELHQGEAELRDKGGANTILQQRIVTLENGAFMSQFEKTDELKWEVSKTPLRKYTFEETGQVQLTWQGEAELIQIRRSGFADEKIEVAKQSLAELELAPGYYTLRLIQGERYSDSLPVEIWTAPSILLRKPFPRDRLSTHRPQEFIWSAVDRIKEYRLRLYNADGSFSFAQSSPSNFMSVQFKAENDLLWTVEAIDHEGYVIPGPPAERIFIRDDPFDAPKLKAPTLGPPGPRAPASDEETTRPPKREPGDPAVQNFNSPQFNFRSPHFVFSRLPQFVALLLRESVASAAEPVSPQNLVATKPSFEAHFTWESVPGADQYIIEMSTAPDFRSGITSVTVQEPQFKWRFRELDTVYWRVAAGSSQGRMGVFTHPAELRLREINDLKLGEEKTINGVIFRHWDANLKPAVVPQAKAALTPVPTITPIPTPTPTLTPTPTPSPIATPEPTPQPTPKPTPVPTPTPIRQTYCGTTDQSPAKGCWDFSLRPHARAMNLRAPEDVAAQTSGLVLSSAQLEYTRPVNKTQYWVTSVAVSGQKLKAKERTTFQSDLQLWSVSARFEKGDLRKSTRWGFEISLDPKLYRWAAEVIAVQSTPSIGVSGAGAWSRQDRFAGLWNIGVSTSGQALRLNLGSELRFYFARPRRNRWYWGGYGFGSGVTGQGLSGSDAQIGLLLGRELQFDP